MTLTNQQSFIRNSTFKTNQMQIKVLYKWLTKLQDVRITKSRDWETNTHANKSWLNKTALKMGSKIIYREIIKDDTRNKNNDEDKMMKYYT